MCSHDLSFCHAESTPWIMGSHVSIQQSHQQGQGLHQGWVRTAYQQKGQRAVALPAVPLSLPLLAH